MRDAEYWADRALNEMLMGERSVLEYEDTLLLAYRIALREIEKDVAAFYAKYAKDNKVSYAEARKRLDIGEIKEFRAVLSKWLHFAERDGWSAEYIRYLKKMLSMKYVSRLEMLEADIRHEIEVIEQGKHIDVTELLIINYLASFYDRSYNIAHGTGVGVRFNAPDKSGVERAVKTRWSQFSYSQTIWNDRDKLVHALSIIIPQSFSRGLNSRQLGDMIAKEMKTSLNRGKTLARTEVNHICNQADLDAYRIAEVEKYQYLATLDMRTSEICRGLDGSIYKVSEATTGVNFPPMHPNCRSTTVPHFDDRFVDERIARDTDGQNIKVPRNMTQEEYINRYAPEEDRDRLLRFRKKYYKVELSGLYKLIHI